MTSPARDRGALTVESLVAESGLVIAAGEGAAGASVRWVHITELVDPTPWLSGGELLLTTGIQLHAPSEQRDFLRRLHRHGLAGLGFGTGFDHGSLPEALVAEARELDFPLFEVPYRMPFIAITERAFTRIVNQGYETLRRGAEIQRHLERLVLEERGLDEVVRALAAAVDGPVCVLEPRGATIASSGPGRDFPEEALADVRRRIADQGVASTSVAFEPEHPEIRGRSLALPIVSPGGRSAQAWLVAMRDAGAPGEFERLMLQQAVIVVALELMRLRVARDTERRLAGDVLAEALTGRMEPEELERRLRPFGVGARAAVLAFSLDDPGAGEPVLDRVAAEGRLGALVAARDGLLCAVIDPDAADPPEIAARARTELVEKVGGDVRAAVSRAAPAASLRRSFHEARCALEAAAIADGDAPEVASHRDLGAFELLLSLQDDDALRLYCDNVLAPLEDSSGDYGDELIRSLEAFIEQNGQWERAARQLYCHRHTLRYRVQRIQELTGRDLSRARDRIEFWLALRGREMVR